MSASRSRFSLGIIEPITLVATAALIAAIAGTTLGISILRTNTENRSEAANGNLCRAEGGNCYSNTYSCRNKLTGPPNDCGSGKQCAEGPCTAPGSTPAPTTSSQRFSCNALGSCVSNNSGRYTSRDCNNECRPDPTPASSCEGQGHILCSAGQLCVASSEVTQYSQPPRKCCSAGCFTPSITPTRKPTATPTRTPPTKTPTKKPTATRTPTRTPTPGCVNQGYNLCPAGRACPPNSEISRYSSSTQKCCTTTCTIPPTATRTRTPTPQRALSCTEGGGKCVPNSQICNAGTLTHTCNAGNKCVKTTTVCTNPTPTPGPLPQCPTANRSYECLTRTACGQEGGRVQSNYRCTDTSAVCCYSPVATATPSPKTPIYNTCADYDGKCVPNTHICTNNTTYPANCGINQKCVPFKNSCSVPNQVTCIEIEKRDYYNSGYTHLVSSNEAAYLESEFDMCFDSTKLIEVFCDGNQINQELFNCPYGCSKGACLRSSPTPTPTPECRSGRTRCCDPESRDGCRDELLTGTAFQVCTNGYWPKDTIIDCPGTSFCQTGKCITPTPTTRPSVTPRPSIACQIPRDCEIAFIHSERICGTLANGDIVKVNRYRPATCINGACVLTNTAKQDPTLYVNSVHSNCPELDYITKASPTPTTGPTRVPSRTPIPDIVCVVEGKTYSQGDIYCWNNSCQQCLGFNAHTKISINDSRWDSCPQPCNPWSQVTTTQTSTPNIPNTPDVPTTTYQSTSTPNAPTSTALPPNPITSTSTPTPPVCTRYLAGRCVSPIEMLGAPQVSTKSPQPVCVNRILGICTKWNIPTATPSPSTPSQMGEYLPSQTSECSTDLADCIDERHFRFCDNGKIRTFYCDPADYYPCDPENGYCSAFREKG